MAEDMLVVPAGQGCIVELWFSVLEAVSGRARSLAYESMKQPKCIEDGVPGYWEANSGSHCGVQSNSSLSLLWLVACISVL